MSVELGLGERLRGRRSRDALRNPAAWELSVDGFRARAGTASALELIASERGSLRVTEGPHPHCASEPMPPPPYVAGLTRIAVQPRDPESCLTWWTVDAFVSGDGKIRAVTFDVWEPEPYGEGHRAAEPCQSERGEVRRRARAAGVAADRGHRRVLAVLARRLHHPPLPDRLHALIYGATSSPAASDARRSEASRLAMVTGEPSTAAEARWTASAPRRP